jgi:hypothetical protein
VERQTGELQFDISFESDEDYEIAASVLGHRNIPSVGAKLSGRDNFVRGEYAGGKPNLFRYSKDLRFGRRFRCACLFEQIKDAF